MCIFNCQYCNKGQPHRCRNCGMLDSHFTRNCPNKSKVFRRKITKKSYFGSSHGIFINRSFKKGHVKEPCILLIKEKYGKYAGKLNMPGGKIELGYNAKATMEKEADEEFGVSLGNVVRSKSYFRKLYFKNNKKTHIFLVELPKGFSRIGYNPLQFPSETNGSYWVPVSYLKNGYKTVITTDGVAETVSSFTMGVIRGIKNNGWI